jgi:hypothetical protein
MRLCDGLISWSSCQSDTYESRWSLNSPEDLECVDEPVNLTFWETSDAGMFAASLFQGLFALQTPNRPGSQPIDPLQLNNITILLIVAGLHHVYVPLNGSLIDTNQTLHATWPVYLYIQGTNGQHAGMAADGLIRLRRRDDPARYPSARCCASPCFLVHDIVSSSGSHPRSFLLEHLASLRVFTTQPNLAVLLHLLPRYTGRKDQLLTTDSHRLLWPTFPLVKEWPAQWLASLQDMDRHCMRNVLSDISVRKKCCLWRRTSIYTFG